MRKARAGGFRGGGSRNCAPVVEAVDRGIGEGEQQLHTSVVAAELGGEGNGLVCAGGGGIGGVGVKHVAMGVCRAVAHGVVLDRERGVECQVDVILHFL